MPRVGDKHFPYTPKGKMDAEMAKKAQKMMKKGKKKKGR